MVTRNKHSVLNLCEYIYAFGGRNEIGELDSVECYSTDNGGKWILQPPMREKRFDSTFEYLFSADILLHLDVALQQFLLIELYMVHFFSFIFTLHDSFLVLSGKKIKIRISQI